MDLSQLIADLKQTYVDFTAGKPLTAWEDTIKVQQTVINLARQLTGFQSAGPVATFHTQQGQSDELTLACEDLRSCCEHPPTMAANDPVQKLGDGVILKQLTDLIVTLLPLILSLFAKKD